jgi:sec-independent protein translocase protein TatC
MGQEKKLTITEHLQELRGRLLKSFIAVGAGTVVSFFFVEKFFQLLTRPAGGVELIYIEVTEMLGTYIKVALLGGVVLALPVVVYQAVMFIAPALTPREKRVLYTYLPGVTVAFVTGVLFGYFVLLPPALKFLFTFGSDIAAPQIRIGNYISVVTTLLFWLGVSFETPFLMMILSRMGIVSPQKFARFRKFAILSAFILGGLITPTMDPINQGLVALPIVVLYEAGILLAKLVARKEPRSAPRVSEVTEIK